MLCQMISLSISRLARGPIRVNRDAVLTLWATVVAERIG
jgi:hypothetical protein